MDIDPKIVEQTAPGLLGSLGAILFMRGRPWGFRIGMFILGMSLAYYTAGVVSSVFKIPELTAGFFTAWLGLLLLIRIIEEWEKVELGTIFVQWIRKLLGLGSQ